MTKRKQTKSTRPAMNEDKATAAVQTATLVQTMANSAELPHRNEETATLPVDLEAEFTKRAEALKQEESRIEEVRKKLKLDQDALDVDMASCRDEKTRLETWDTELREKEKALNAREAAVAVAEKTVDDDFEEKRRIFRDEMTKKKEEALASLAKEEREWRSGFDTRRDNAIRALQVLQIGGNHLALVDEEGLLRDWKAGFRFPKSQGIAGNALIVCEKRNGDFTDAKAPVELFQLCTTFIDLKKNPLPPPAFGVAFISDMSPAGIEKARAEALRDLEQHR